jgi:hypothetical protein
MLVEGFERGDLWEPFARLDFVGRSRRQLTRTICADIEWVEVLERVETCEAGARVVAQAWLCSSEVFRAHDGLHRHCQH